MVVGFNHNFRYKGEMFHVQTEDGGLKSPNIVTLLYRGGTILGSQKTSYADISKIDNLEQVVEELMKEQHKEMLRRLKAGDFDEVIAGRVPSRKASEPAPAEVAAAAGSAAVPAAPAAEPPAASPAPAAARPAPSPSPAAAPVAPEPVAPAPAAKAPEPEPSVELGLDDIILSYLVGDDK